MPIRLWNSSLRVNETDVDLNGNDQFGARSVQLDDGTILFVWTTNSDNGSGSPVGRDILARVFDINGIPVTGEYRVNGLTSRQESLRDLVLLPNGKIFMSYSQNDVPQATNDFDIRFNVLDAEGLRETSGTIIADTDTSDAGRVAVTLDAAVNGAGLTAVLYQEFKPGGLFASGTMFVKLKIYDASQTLLRTQSVTSFIIDSGKNEDFMGGSITALADGSFVIALADEDEDPGTLVGDSQILLKRVSANGTLQPGTSVGADLPNARLSAPAVTALAGNGDALSDGGFALTHLQGSGFQRLVTTIFKADGTVLSLNALAVDDTGLADQASFDVVALANGDLMYVWVRTTTNQVVARVLQTLEPNGFEFGDTLVLADFTNGQASQPFDLNATVLEDGRVSVSFTSVASSNADVRFLIVDPRDAPDAEPDSSGNQVGTPLNDSFTLAQGTVDVYGGRGNDRISLSASQVDTSDLFDGGAGVDTLVLTTGEFFNFRGETLNSIEEIEFLASVNGQRRFGQFFASQLESVLIIDFDANPRDIELVDVFMGGRTSADFRLLSLQDFSAADDRFAVFGDSDAESIIGTNSNDVLVGAGGNDVLNGADGDDLIVGGSGVDALDGGIGVDTLDVSQEGLVAGARINLAAGNFSYFVASSPVFVSVFETAVNFEKVIATAFNDIITGSATALRLEGRDGDDTITGNGGPAELIGGNGNDLLIGDFSTVGYDGGAGNDTIRMTGNLSFGIDLRAGVLSNGLTGTPNRPIVSVENAIGGDAADQIVGTSGRNRLEGGGGDDTLRGGGGVDDFNGGQGIDTVDLSDSTSFWVIDLDAQTATVTSVTGKATAVDFLGVENVIASRRDTVVRDDDGNTTFTGSSAKDTFRSIGGKDIFIAGFGVDTLDLSEREFGVTVRGSSGISFRDSTTVVVFSSVENFTGTAFDDDMTGTIGRNVMIGGSGADKIRSGSGDDIIEGGPGDDNLGGGGGKDRFVLASDGSTDTIIDFEDGVDLLDLRGTGANSVADIRVEQAGSNVVMFVAGAITPFAILQSQSTGFFDEADALFS